MRIFAMFRFTIFVFLALALPWVSEACHAHGIYEPAVHMEFTASLICDTLVSFGNILSDICEHHYMKALFGPVAEILSRAMRVEQIPEESKGLNLPQCTEDDFYNATTCGLYDNWPLVEEVQSENEAKEKMTDFTDICTEDILTNSTEPEDQQYTFDFVWNMLMRGLEDFGISSMSEHVKKMASYCTTEITIMDETGKFPAFKIQCIDIGFFFFLILGGRLVYSSIMYVTRRFAAPKNDVASLPDNSSPRHQDVRRFNPEVGDYEKAVNKGRCLKPVWFKEGSEVQPKDDERFVYPIEAEIVENVETIEEFHVPIRTLRMGPFLSKDAMKPLPEYSEYLAKEIALPRSKKLRRTRKSKVPATADEDQGFKVYSSPLQGITLPTIPEEKDHHCSNMGTLRDATDSPHLRLEKDIPYNKKRTEATVIRMDYDENGDHMNQRSRQYKNTNSKARFSDTVFRSGGHGPVPTASSDNERQIIETPAGKFKVHKACTAAKGMVCGYPEELQSGKTLKQWKTPEFDSSPIKPSNNSAQSSNIDFSSCYSEYPPFRVDRAEGKPRKAKIKDVEEKPRFRGGKTPGDRGQDPLPTPRTIQKSKIPVFFPQKFVSEDYSEQPGSSPGRVRPLDGGMNTNDRSSTSAENQTSRHRRTVVGASTSVYGEASGQGSTRSRMVKIRPTKTEVLGRESMRKKTRAL